MQTEKSCIPHRQDDALALVRAKLAEFQWNFIKNDKMLFKKIYWSVNHRTKTFTFCVLLETFSWITKWKCDGTSTYVVQLNSNCEVNVAVLHIEMFKGNLEWTCTIAPHNEVCTNLGFIGQGLQCNSFKSFHGTTCNQWNECSIHGNTRSRLMKVPLK